MGKKGKAVGVDLRSLLLKSEVDTVDSFNCSLYLLNIMN